MSQRFSIIPARAVLDKNLTDLDIRVLAILGIHSDKNGWCFKNQSKIAEELGVARQSVSRCCARLYAAGYLEARDINEGKKVTGLRSINCYRVICDPKEGPEESTKNAMSPQEDNEAALSPGGFNRCNSEDAAVETPARQLNVPLRTYPLERKGPAGPKSDFGKKGKDAPPTKRDAASVERQQVGRAMKDLLAGLRKGRS